MKDYYELKCSSTDQNVRNFVFTLAFSILLLLLLVCCDAMLGKWMEGPLFQKKKLKLKFSYFYYYYICKLIFVHIIINPWMEMYAWTSVLYYTL